MAHRLDEQTMEEKKKMPFFKRKKLQSKQPKSVYKLISKKVGREMLGGQLSFETIKAGFLKKTTDRMKAAGMTEKDVKLRLNVANKLFETKILLEKQGVFVPLTVDPLNLESSRKHLREMRGLLVFSKGTSPSEEKKKRDIEKL